jgi:hypothetical protein
MQALLRHCHPPAGVGLLWVSAWIAMAQGVPVAEAQSAAEVEVAPDHEAPADEGAQSARASFPLRLTERPLTLPRGKIALTSGVSVELQRLDLRDDECVLTMSGEICFSDGRSNTETVPGSAAGVAIGAIDALEIGLVPIRLREGQIGPEGDRESAIRDPLLYLEAAALRLAYFQLGFGYQLLLPLRSDTTTLTQAVTLDLLARSRFVRAEASAFVRFDSPIRKSTTLTAGERVITPGVAVEVTGQVTDPFALFLGFQSSFFDARVEGHTTDIRAGVVGTVRRSSGEPLADLRFTFGALDVKREEEGRIRECRPGDCGVVPAATPPVKRYTFGLDAAFYFHDAW